jgi:hypothetical protein
MNTSGFFCGGGTAGALAHGHYFSSYRSPGSFVYPPERDDRGQYLLWLSEAEANRLAALRRRGESYSDAVIRMAKAQD